MAGKSGEDLRERLPGILSRRYRSQFGARMGKQQPDQFLPGIAGLYGKPLWSFYVNRGQCMASFGTSAKECAIMEFYPADTAYRRTSLEGFRTFIKIKGKGDVYEPFAIHSTYDKRSPVQRLYISPHEFRIEEIDRKRALRCEAVFYTIPNENFPALAS
jgi:hypothetical protein